MVDPPLLDKNDLRTFIDKQRKRYDSCWFKNTTRVGQAGTLFGKLDRSSQKNTSGVRYYEELLEAIIETQTRILNQDRQRKYNGKGHSRLYDITNEMFIKIMRMCLNDSNLINEFQQKQRLHALFVQQFDMNLTTLQECLPDGHILKQKLLELIRNDQTNSNAMFHGIAHYSHRWKPNSTEMVDLCEIFKRPDIKKLIPKHLHFLVTNLEGYLEFSRPCQTQPEQNPRLGSVYSA